jgi:hypothetical protein
LKVNQKIIRRFWSQTHITQIAGSISVWNRNSKTDLIMVFELEPEIKVKNRSDKKSCPFPPPTSNVRLLKTRNRHPPPQTVMWVVPPSHNQKNQFLIYNHGFQTCWRNQITAHKTKWVAQNIYKDFFFKCPFMFW